MLPKPPPSSDLLASWQEWVIVPSVDWELATGKQQCYFAMGQKHPCGAPALVKAVGQQSFSREGLCEDHMGSFQWVSDEGVLLQWRANPYYQNKVPKKYERWRKRSG